MGREQSRQASANDGHLGPRLADVGKGHGLWISRDRRRFFCSKWNWEPNPQCVVGAGAMGVARCHNVLCHLVGITYGCTNFSSEQRALFFSWTLSDFRGAVWPAPIMALLGHDLIGILSTESGVAS